MIDLEGIQRVADCAKTYLAERKRYERMSEKSFGEMSPKQRQKSNADLNWQAMALSKSEHGLHAACVDAGIADLRDTERYDTVVYRPAGWHEYRYDPPKPRALARKALGAVHTVEGL